jgi:hypothetical protein
MKKIIITLLVLRCLSLQVLAEEIALQTDAPSRHVVVKGDTLWAQSVADEPQRN